MTDLISVVLPTLNGAAYIAQAIESVRTQTYPYWELIVVDSFSTDGTPDIVADFIARDDRIRLIQHPKEAGRLPGALNAGFAQANGVYHTWLSDDNYYRPHAFATMLGYLEAHPEIGLVYSHYTERDETTGRDRLTKMLPPRYLAEKNIITPSFMYRAAVYAQIGEYRTQYFLAEDYDYWIRARDVVPFHLIEEDLHVYRFHDDMLTSTEQRRQIDDVVEQVLLDRLADTQWTKQADSRGRMYFYLALMAQRHHRWRACAQYWLTAARYKPFYMLRRTIKPMIPRRLRRYYASH